MELFSCIFTLSKYFRIIKLMIFILLDHLEYKGIKVLSHHRRHHHRHHIKYITPIENYYQGLGRAVVATYTHKGECGQRVHLLEKDQEKFLEPIGLSEAEAKSASMHLITQALPL